MLLDIPRLQNVPLFGKVRPAVLRYLLVQGIWAPRKIDNPDYFDDPTPLKNIAPIGGVALEIWTMDEGYFFDNVLVANDADVAADHRERYTVPKQKIEVSFSTAQMRLASTIPAQHALPCSRRLPIFEVFISMTMSW